MYIYKVLCIKSPVEVVGLGQVFGEADVPREVLVNYNVVVVLQPDFVVPKKTQMGQSLMSTLSSL